MHPTCQSTSESSQSAKSLVALSATLLRPLFLTSSFDFANQFVVPMASHEFAGIPELLFCLGQVIINKRLLYNLCLTNKACNVAITPLLYSELSFHQENAYILLNPEQVDTIVHNRALRFTKKFDFCVTLGSGGNNHLSRGSRCQLQNEAVQRLLSRMPNLLSF